jgi:secreted PhoX family phosphatase
VYASNAESAPAVGPAAVSAIHFGPDGQVRDAYMVLTGTAINCAGGGTPWGTWLSGEEHAGGQIWECDPFHPSQGVPRPALGIYKHEAAAVDGIHRHVYLTEDEGDGRLYRFVPRNYPDLSIGRLEVAAVDGPGNVTWIPVSDGPVGATKPRPAGSTAFDGGEGIFCRGSHVYFTTKGDTRLWRLDTIRQTLCVLYDGEANPGAPLHGVDNVFVSAAGEVFVCEDGNDQQINVVRAGEVVGPLLQLVDQENFLTPGRQALLQLAAGARRLVAARDRRHLRGDRPVPPTDQEEVGAPPASNHDHRSAFDTLGRTTTIGQRARETVRWWRRT